MTEPSFTEEDREQLRDLADHVDECAWTQDARSIESALAYIEELEARLARAETEDVEALRVWRALQRIASMPTVERNPDGVDQAAASMQLVAQAALTRAEGRDAG